MDLTPALAKRLVHGLAENHRLRLVVLVRNGGRASMVALLDVTGDRDVRILSYFQGALSRKVRRLIRDPEKRLHLMGWDYETTKWDAGGVKIIDGDCYITKRSVAALSKAMNVPVTPKNKR